MVLNSKILDKLEPKIKSAVDLIKSAIEDKRPILIRHHADCDGYSAGVLLEKAILPLMQKRHRRETDVFYYFRRLPSRTPFYDYIDATKDISNFLSDSARFERKTPLVIVVDNGSSKQDLMSLMKLKAFDVQIIVIDHHPHDVECDKYIDVHINPHHVGSATEFCAGMLAYAVSRKLGLRDDKAVVIAALSGVADHIMGEELNQLIKQAGYPLKRLKELGKAIDFETTSIGFLESRQLVSELFFGKRSKSLLKIASDQINKEEKELIKIIMHYHDQKDMGGYIIARIDVSKTRNNSKSGAGRITGIMCAQINEKPVVGLGYGENFITFRIADELKFDVNKIIARLKEELPYAGIDGGGHAHAGTIRFVSLAFDEVMEKVMKYLS